MALCCDLGYRVHADAFSSNGADLVRINREPRSIEHIEVKCSQCTSPALPTGDPTAKFTNWINQASAGNIAGKPVSASERALAQEIARLRRDEGHALDNKLMQVRLPTNGSTGVPTAELRDWLGPNVFSPCITTVCR